MSGTDPGAPEQVQRARAEVGRLIAAGRTLLVPLLALVATTWVFRSAYALDKATVANTLARILDWREVRVGEGEVVVASVTQAVPYALVGWVDGPPYR